MKVLFTNNHVLNEKNIKQNSIIEIQQKNNKYKIKKVKIDLLLQMKN